jgi:hypothetical protein
MIRDVLVADKNLKLTLCNRVTSIPFLPFVCMKIVQWRSDPSERVRKKSQPIEP